MSPLLTGVRLSGNKYADIDAPAEIDAVMPILAEVRNELGYPRCALNKESASMPAEWFVAWLSQLPGDKATPRPGRGILKIART